MNQIIMLSENETFEPLDARNFDDDNQIYVLMGEHLYTYYDEFYKEEWDEIINWETAENIEYITDGKDLYRLLW